MNSIELNIQRIKTMISYLNLCKCPNCHKLVFPKYIDYPFNNYSGLLWCPSCYKGKASFCWVEL
jgi:hypothetical protein